MDVAIVGAGLSGLLLALALHQQGIESTIFESRSAPMNIGGAVMLSPNALRIFDNLNLYDQIRSKGYNFDTVEYRTPANDLIDTATFGGEARYGYRGNRVYRYELIDILLEAVRNAGIEVHYGHKLSHIVEESEKSVTFTFTNGTTSTADMLVGADGIHSTVRRHLYPDASDEPRFIGQAGITATVPTSNLSKDTVVDKVLTFISPSKGAFILAPQKVDGSELLIIKQKRIAGNPTRADWDAIYADKASCIEYLRQDIELFGAIPTSCVRTIDPNTIHVWPLYVVPKLERWTSVARRIVLVGDAAHAIPPSAGQGINQAMEDVYMLALLVKEVQKSSGGGKLTMGNAMTFWQTFRQERVNKVLELNGRVEKRRLPRLEGQPEIEREEWDLDWLYGVDIARSVEEWVVHQQQ